MTDLHDITYGFSETPFGPIIAARNVKGYTDVQFLTYNRAETIHELGTRWGVYTPTVQDDRVAEIVKKYSLTEPIISSSSISKVLTSRKRYGVRYA